MCPSFARAMLCHLYARLCYPYAVRTDAFSLLGRAVRWRATPLPCRAFPGGAAPSLCLAVLSLPRFSHALHSPSLPSRCRPMMGFSHAEPALALPCPRCARLCCAAPSPCCPVRCFAHALQAFQPNALALPCFAVLCHRGACQGRAVPMRGCATQCHRRAAQRRAKPLHR